MKQSTLFALLPALVAAGPGINPNPSPNFDPSTSPGTFGPFVPAQRALSSATGGPNQIDERTKQAMQLAISNWMTDTGIVSAFQNSGPNTQDAQAFMGTADGAFKAEVDELSQKAVLDAAIGNDPRVSIANQTLTNGVFQSVVDNLQIMSIQGRAKVNLVDSINQVRCTQILPSIDTYMVVAAEYIGDNAQQRRAVRPTACQQILAANSGNSSAFPNVPGTPAGTPKGTGNGDIAGVPGVGQMGGGNLSKAGGNNTGNANVANGASAPVASPLANQTTPQLALPAYQSAAAGNTNANTTAANNGTTAANTGNTGNTANGKTTKKTKKAKKAKTAKGAKGAKGAGAALAGALAGAGGQKATRSFKFTLA